MLGRARIRLAVVTLLGLAATAVGWSVATEPTVHAAVGYQALTPARILDTRPTGPVAADSHIDVDVTGVGGVPATGVGAVVLNVTATQPTANTWVTVWPTGEPRPDASNLNVVAGQSAPNLVIATVGADGHVSLYNHAGDTHLIADVTGWFPAGSDYQALTPARILDTRPTGAVAADSHIDVDVTGVGGVPATGVGAVVLNVTAAGATADTWATIWPTGQARPDASNLNVAAGVDRPNAVIATVGADGKVSLYNFAGDSHYIVDVTGWLPGTPTVAPGELDGTLFYRNYDGLVRFDLDDSPDGLPTTIYAPETFDGRPRVALTAGVFAHAAAGTNPPTDDVVKVRSLTDAGIVHEFTWADATRGLRSAPEMSPDGEYFIARIGTNDSSSNVVQIVDRDGISLGSFADSSVRDWEWTPSGDLLLAVDVSDTGSSTGAIVSVSRDEITSGDDLDSTVLQQFPDHIPLDLTVSLDGSQLAYTLDGRVHAAPLQVGFVGHPLVTGTYGQRSPTFSPDGSHVAFILDVSLYHSIHVVPNHRGAAIEVTLDGPTVVPSGTPSGSLSADEGLGWGP